MIDCMRGNESHVVPDEGSSSRVANKTIRKVSNNVFFCCRGFAIGPRATVSAKHVGRASKTRSEFFFCELFWTKNSQQVKQAKQNDRGQSKHNAVARQSPSRQVEKLHWNGTCVNRSPQHQSCQPAKRGHKCKNGSIILRMVQTESFLHSFTRKQRMRGPPNEQKLQNVRKKGSLVKRNALVSGNQRIERVEKTSVQRVV